MNSGLQQSIKVSHAVQETGMHEVQNGFLLLTYCTQPEGMDKHRKCLPLFFDRQLERISWLQSRQRGVV